MRNKGRQDPREGGLTFQQRERGNKTPGKADTPSNKGKKGDYNGRKRETRPWARRAHHPTKGNNQGCTGRQRETRPSGRRTHHPKKHRPTKGNKGVQMETKGEKGKKTVGKADTPSNTKADTLR